MCKVLDRFLCWLGCFIQPFFLLAVRLIWGLLLVQTGWGKLTNIEAVIELFTELGILWPEFNAYLVAGTELVCGALLVLGLYSRFAAVPVVIIMLVAYATAHYEAVANIMTDPQQIMKESPFTYLLAALIIWTTGPGVFSLDWLRGKWCHKNVC